MWKYVRKIGIPVCSVATLAYWYHSNDPPRQPVHQRHLQACNNQIQSWQPNSVSKCYPSSLTFANTNTDAPLHHDPFDLSDLMDRITKPLFRMARSIELDLLNDPDNSRPVALLIGLNALVLLGWKAASVFNFNSFMVRHFTSSNLSVSSPKYWHTLLTASVSHYSFLHFAANMFVLWNFGPVVRAGIGADEDFFFLYGLAGISSSLLGVVTRRVLKHTSSYSLGASGSILGLVFWYEQAQPFQMVSVLGYPTTLQNVARGLVTLDILGVVNRWQFLDHAGHLGGAMMGLGMYQYQCRLKKESTFLIVYRIQQRRKFELKKMYQLEQDESRVFWDGNKPYSSRGGGGGWGAPEDQPFPDFARDFMSRLRKAMGADDSKDKD